MANLAKLATVFDAMADYIEEREREKTSASAIARATRIDKIATMHVSTHGEELPADMRQKLATTDDATLDVVENLLAKQAGIVTSLGAGATSETLPPATTKEAAEAADDRFLSWIVT